MFIIVFFGDPHAGEGGQWGQSGSSSPDGESSVWAGNNLDVDWFRCSGFDFLKKSFTDSFEHGGSSWKNDVQIEVSSDINIAFLDGFVGQVLDGVEFSTVHFEGLEQIFWASESSVSNGDDFTVWEFVSLFDGGWVLRLFHWGFIIYGNEAGLLLNVSDDFKLGSGHEVVASFGKEFSHEFSQVSTS